VPKIQSFRLMLMATIITITIVCASQLFTFRISALLDRQANELLAADLVVTSNQPLPKFFRLQAIDLGLKVANTTELRTAIFIDDEPQLVELKAVESSYPLRGKLERSSRQEALGKPVSHGPEAGEIWIESKLRQQLHQSIQLGKISLTANWILSFEPDRGGSLFNLAPRIMMNEIDLANTGLIVPGSRVTYRLLVAGENAPLIQYRQLISSQKTIEHSIQTINNARPEMRTALQRTKRFFSLSIVLTLVIAMVAIAISARYAAQNESNKIAMLRVFGISQRQLFSYYLKQLLWVWLLALPIGLLLGWIAQFPLQWILADWFASELPGSNSVKPYTSAAVIGLLCLVGFSLPFILQVLRTAPMLILRGNNQLQNRWQSIALVLLTLFSLFSILLLLVDDLELASMTLLFIVSLALIMPFCFWLIIQGLLRFFQKRFWLGGYLLTRLQSSRRSAIFVMSGFSLVMMAVLLIAVVKDDLIRAWQQQLPQDIPNYFLINIPTDQVDSLSSYLEQKGINSSNSFPIVRTRLTAINRVDIRTIHFTHDRAEHMVNHVFNLSYSESLPPDNEVIEGLWLNLSASEPAFSLEHSLAERLGLKLGDELTFSISGESVTAPVTSIRSVVWENFRPNFYVLSNRALLQQLPQTWMLSANFSDRQREQMKGVLARFPTITLLDVSVLINRIKGIINRAGLALEFFFLFALLAAFIVLLAAIQTGRQERERETALLRALGISSNQLYRVHWMEFALVGLLTGLFALIATSLAAWIISERFFDLSITLSGSVWVVGLTISIGVLSVTGLLVSRKVYNISPMSLLRFQP